MSRIKVFRKGHSLMVFIKTAKNHQCSVYKIRLMKCLVDRAYEIRNTWIKLNDDLMNIKNRILY